MLKWVAKYWYTVEVETSNPISTHVWVTKFRYIIVCRADVLGWNRSPRQHLSATNIPKQNTHSYQWTFRKHEPYSIFYGKYLVSYISASLIYVCFPQLSPRWHCIRPQMQAAVRIVVLLVLWGSGDLFHKGFVSSTSKSCKSVYCFIFHSVTILHMLLQLSSRGMWKCIPYLDHHNHDSIKVILNIVFDHFHKISIRKPKFSVK